MREIDKKKVREERTAGRMGRRIPVWEGRHLFHITAFNLRQVLKLADNSDSFAYVSHEEIYTRDTHKERFPPLSLRNGGKVQICGERG